MLDPKKFIEKTEEDIKKNLIGKGILACSGGQDSTLLAVMLNKAFGDRILTVFIDTGFLRENERDDVERKFKRYSLNYKMVDASERFLENLKGITDPEKKRKIIGKTFIDVFEEVAREYGADSLLQGTIAPDWIESGDNIRDTIKSHHNVGGLPKKMNLKIIEPLRDLYKDEIRKLSGYLDLSDIIQPFPGPGLSIRIIGEVTKDSLDLLRGITKIVEEAVEKKYKGNGLIPWQFFAILLPIKTTGIHGDRRTYGYTLVIRMVDSIDAMSATFTKPSWEFLEELSTKITNEFHTINRVVYDITDKPPGTIEWE